MELIDGKKIAQEIKNEIVLKIEKLTVTKNNK